MNIYHVKRKSCCDYDEYSDFVVVAKTHEEAALYHPSGGLISEKRYSFNGWTSPEDLEVKYIGEASPDIAVGTVITLDNKRENASLRLCN